MSFDGSRFTFDPWNDFSGVVMQQGRVQLDSDWNEWLAELGRRIRAGTLDTFGRAVVPLTTKTGFQITLNQDASGNVSILIGTGRMYVDGRLAENHGLPAPNSQKWIPPSGPPPVTGQVWDSALEELKGQAGLGYDQQPYFPNTDALSPFPQAGGPYLIYVDVWQREVTFLEDPDLVEKAVGVDTTGRLQTVWQVKRLDVSGVPGVNCATPDARLPAAWQNLLLPPGPRLTTGVVQSSPSGPCCLTPNTGYTGLENQLYRVEIHQPGTASGGSPAATFKVSRDNASMATGVTEITQGGTVLTVQSSGKDDVLRFSPNNWVEITDDWLELNGFPGELHRVASVNDAAKTITLASSVSPASFPVDGTGLLDASRHTRLTRWDQSGKVFEADGVTVWTDLDAAGSSGDIPVPPAGTSLILENGITISFSMVADAGPFKTGDHWEFAARTADGTVEFLNAAPPRGIYHHYARLAVMGLSSVKLAATGTLTLQDQSQPPIAFLTFQATDNTGWPANFGVSTRANAMHPANFDLEVLYTPAAAQGVSTPIVVETFSNLSLDPAAANFAPNVLKSSSLITVPASYVPPSTKPVFSPNFSSSPTPLPASGTFQLNDASGPPIQFLTLQSTSTAEWPPNFAVSASPGGTIGTFNLEIVYSGQGGNSSATLERFANLSLGSIASQVSSQFITSVATPLKAPFPALNLTTISDCRSFWPPPSTQGSPALHVKAINWTNDDVMPVGVFMQGLQILLDGPPLRGSVSASTMIVTIEPPAGTSGILISEILESAGTPVVNPGSPLIFWLPPKDFAFPTLRSPGPLRVRVRLLGHFIWGTQGNGLIYLDGQVFGMRATNAFGTPITSLVLPSGNGARASDFESWFWLLPSSPLQFTVDTPVAAVIRAEGLAEEVSDIVLRGTGGTPTPQGTPVSLVNIDVTLNVSVTSRLFELTAPLFLDAVLLIDEPGAPPSNAGKLNTSPAPPAPVGVGGNGLDFKDGLAPNTIIGQVIPSTPNKVTFFNVPLDPPGGATRIFRITNIRVNASTLNVASTAPVSQVLAQIAISGPVPVAVNNPTVVVGSLSAGAVATVVNTSPAGGIFTINPNAGVNPGSVKNPEATGVINVVLQFTEGFASAFKPRTVQQSFVPGAAYAAEETFDGTGISLVPGAPALNPLLGHADQGTQFVARFQNVPPNVRVFVTTRDVPAGGVKNPDNPPALAVLQNPSGGGTSKGGVPLGTGGLTSGATPGIPIDLVALSNGTGVAIWEWVGAPRPTSVDALQLGVVLAMAASGSPPAPLTATVNLSLGPLSSAGSASEGDPIPRFTDVSKPLNAFMVARLG